MALLLSLFSFFNRSGCRLKEYLYSKGIFTPKTAPLPVISVGSTSLGGSGKTPLAAALLEHINGSGIQAALISRGYKGRWEKKGGVLSDGKDVFGSWREAGDEPFMVHKRIPQAGIYVGKNRFSSCRKAYEAGFQAAILDDGFQHLRLHRDLDIVFFDPNEKIRLRESSSGIKRAQVVLIQNRQTTVPDKMMPLLSQKKVFRYRTDSEGIGLPDGSCSIPFEDLKLKKVFAFCGIARPERFLALLLERGIEPVGFEAFSDHCAYPPRLIKKLASKIKNSGGEIVLTTEKDIHKVSELPLFLHLPLYFLRIRLDIEEGFFPLIQKRLEEILP